MAKPKTTSVSETNELDSYLSKAFGRAYVKDKPLIEFYRTGLANLDRSLGGGIPKGRIVELFGEPSGGKTSLALHLSRELTQMGKFVLYFDLETSIGGPYFESFGLDPDLFKLIQPIEEPISAEQLFQQVNEMTQFLPDLALVVIDSIPALITENEAEADDKGQAPMYSPIAAFLSRKLKHVVPNLARNKTTLLCINRQTEVIGSRVPIKSTPGGQHFKYYCSLRLNIGRIKRPDWDTSERLTVVVKAEKNKVGDPFRTAQFDIVFGLGPDKGSALVQECIDNGSLRKSGSWISFSKEIRPQLLSLGIEQENLAHGIEKAAKALMENPVLFDFFYNLSLAEPIREDEIVMALEDI